MNAQSWSRRRVVCSLGLGVAAAAGALAHGDVLAADAGAALPEKAGSAGAPGKAAGAERWIELKSIHTGEVVKATFGREAGPDAATLAKLQHVLRDYRVNEEHEMDAGLYQQLSDLAEAAGCEPRYEVISGYRSPKTNAQLRANGHGVAEHSLHMEGRAIDVRLKDCPLAKLRDLALQAKRGGVGYYERSNFVHLDTGRVRTWTG
jgi:uncharacterized protein YcbK (DUF882 family)